MKNTRSESQTDAALRHLPCIIAELPGVGGQLKIEPQHFIVDEIPLYQPAGEGEHIYLRFTRQGWTTRGLQKRLAQLFGLKEWEIGYAGLKDKHAQVTQTFSLHLPQAELSHVQAAIEADLVLSLESIARHRNKLRTGHLQGNRFRILLQQPIAGAMPIAEKIAAALKTRGVPNYYGEQRFGFAGDNAARGREVVQGGGVRQPWKKRFLIDALRAELFNTYLAARIDKGWFDKLILGDIARKEDSGGLFEVENVEAEMVRFQKGEISHTGPLYGHKMRWATHEAGALEQHILTEAGLTEEQLRKARAQGTRRAGRLLIDDLALQAHADGIWFAFTLPPGAYATVVLREFTKNG